MALVHLWVILGFCLSLRTINLAFLDLNRREPSSTRHSYRPSS